MTLETLHPGQRAPGGGLLVVGVPGRRRQELVRVDAGLGRRLAVHLAPYPEDGQGSGLFCDSTGWNASLSVERCNNLNIQGIQRDARLTVMAAGMQIVTSCPPACGSGDEAPCSLQKQRCATLGGECGCAVAITSRGTQVPAVRGQGAPA